MNKNQLIDNLRSADAHTAMEAAKAIIANHLKVRIAEIEAIAGAHNDKDWSRISAIYLLGNLRSKKSAPMLAKILEREQEKPVFREFAAEALGNIGDTSFLPIVEKVAMRTDSPEIRTSCEFAVEEMRAANARKSRTC